MPNWDKMDKIAWNNSEVAQELEQNIIKALFKLKDSLDKSADLKDLSTDLSKVNREAGPAKTNLDEISKSVDKMYDADDDIGEDDVTEEDASEELEGAFEEIEEESKSLVDELLSLSYFIADQGDTTLAYKVERLINELKEQLEQDEDSVTEIEIIGDADDKAKLSEKELSGKVDRLVEDSKAEVEPLVKQLLAIYPRELLRLHLITISNGDQRLARVLEKLINKIEASIK